MSIRLRAMFSVVGAGALVLSSLPWAAPAHAATFTVTKTVDTNDGACTPSDCSLREAIIAANNNPGADTINLRGGVHTLTISGPGENAAQTGDLDITGSLTLNGNGSTVDGNDLDRVFHVQNNANVKLLNLTIRNGKASDDGGGVRSDSGTLELSNATVTGNVTSDDGGGVDSNGILRIVNSLISNNEAGDEAGGIDSGGGPTTIIGTTISGNKAGSDGGGMQAQTPTTISNSRFIGNVAAGDGGGLVVATGNTTTLNNVQFSDNTAGDDGGAIQVESGNTLNFNGGQVSENKADHDGGGIDNEGTTNLNRVSIGNNTADANANGLGDAGGFDNTAGTATSTQSQIGGNDDRSGDQFDNCRPASPCPP